MQIQEFINFRNNQCLCGDKLSLQVYTASFKGSKYDIIGSRNCQINEKTILLPFKITPKFKGMYDFIFYMKINIKTQEMSYELDGNINSIDEINKKIYHIKSAFNEKGIALDLSIKKNCYKDNCKNKYSSSAGSFTFDIDNNIMHMKNDYGESYQFNNGNNEILFYTDGIVEVYDLQDENNARLERQKLGKGRYIGPKLILELDKKTYLKLPYDDEKLTQKIKSITAFL